MNITCETCRERWDELFNNSPQGASQSGTNEVSEQAEVREHLAHCVQCQGEFALLKVAREELHVFPVMAAPLDLRARIRQQLEAEAVASVTPAIVAEPVMTPEEAIRHRAQIESKILENTGGSRQETAGQRLRTFWLRFQRNLHHPAAMALSSGAALLLICFVSLNTFQPAQTPQEMPSPAAVMQAEPKEEVQSETTRSKGQERLTAKSRKAAPSRATSQEDTARPPTPGRKGESKPAASNEAESGSLTPRNDDPAIPKVAPAPPSAPKPQPPGKKPSSPPLQAVPAPVSPLPASPRDESADSAAFKAQPAPLPAPDTMVTPQNATPKSTSPAAAMMARESQDTVAEADRADNARGPAGPPQAAMAQRAPELRAVPDKSSSPKHYLARGRGIPERIEASITAPRHIGNAEVVVELPAEAQFSDGSRSRVLWRGSVRKNESIAVKFEAEVEPEAEDARVVLKENKDGTSATVAYKEVPVSEAGRRRSR